MKASDLQVGNILRYCNTFYRVKSVDVGANLAVLFAFGVINGEMGKDVQFFIPNLQEPDEILRAKESPRRIGAWDGAVDAKFLSLFADWLIANRTIDVESEALKRMYRIASDMSAKAFASGAGFGLFATRNDARASAKQIAATAFAVGDLVTLANGPVMTIVAIVEDTLAKCQYFDGSGFRVCEARFKCLRPSPMPAVLPG